MLRYCALIKTSSMKLPLFSFIALGFISLSAVAQDASKPVVSLFDGKTLEGWDYDPEIWRVEDGLITGGSTTEKIKANYFIATKKSYQNFELKLKIKCSGDPETGLINSGIQIRSVRVPGGHHMAGYQVDCGDTWFGKIYDEFRRRKVIAEQVDAAALDKVVDVFGWNDYRIRAEGPRIRVWINDVLATDFTETNPKVALDGQIAPQVHSGGVALVQVKDITVQELPSTPDAPIWKSLGGVAAALKAAPPAPRKNSSSKKKAPAKSKPKPKGGKKTQSGRVEALSPQEQLKGFKVPPGFVIELVASEKNGVINPIDISFDDAGRLWTQTGEMYPLDPISGMVWKQFLELMEDEKTQNEHPEFKRIGDLYKLKTKGKDKILILDDPTKAAEGNLHVWADGLSIPQSVLPYKDGAYVCHGSELFLLRDTDGDDKSDTVEPVLSGFGYTDTHTMSHLLVRGPGSYIHFSQGALNKGMVTAVASGAQHRVDASCQVRFGLDHQDFEVVSSGPSNMWGLQLRANGQWYGTEANDRSYSVIPWEHGTAVTGAAFHPMRPYQPLLPNLHKFRVGGTGISGLEFSEDTEGSFPVEEWKDVALLANCITSTINAVRIHRNPDGTVEAEHLPDFLTATDDWFRPVNLEFGPDGCLYVADFYNKIISHNEVTTDHPDRDHAHGRIWRIRHESQKPRKIPNITEAGPKELIAHLQSPTLWEKRAAWHQIGDRKLDRLAPDLAKLAGNEAIDATTRIHALWSLEELKHFDSELIAGLLKSNNDEIRREAVRSLASFDIPPGEVATRLEGFINDPNVMVRSQTIRTLGDLKQSDPAVIGLLIEACKPALKGNALGGSYERTFERFLARMALEKFPAELKTYLDSSAGDHPAVNILWAIQGLDEETKRRAFLDIWSKVSGETLDGETFVAITGMLGNNEVYEAVKPTFQDLTKAENLVSLSLANQSRVQSKALIEMLTPGVKHLLQSPDTEALGLNAIGKLRIASLDDEVASIKAKEGDIEMQRLLFTARAVNPVKNVASFKAIAADEGAPFDLRIEAAHAIAPVDSKEAYRLAKDLLDKGDATQQGQLASLFSQSNDGAALLCGFIKNKVITAEVFDLSAAERVIQAYPNSPHAKQIMKAAQARVAQQRRDAQKKIHDLVAFIGNNPGDPAKGKLTFGACLACHKVGTEGQEIAPPLDGSGHRELEHLLTALIDPDAAVEGGYGLYRITKTDGSVVEGLLDKEEALGTTIAMMGGARVFVPQADIKKGGFVGGRSFMPSMFGQLPDETIADLVAYVGTLKEGEPEVKATPPQAMEKKKKASAATQAAAAPSAKRPNIIVIFTDDQGYEDLGCFGSKSIKTPNIDQMASEGLKLTNFYAQPVCGVSRAALMTGSYPIRVGEPGNVKRLHTVPHPKEVTMAEVLKSAGYATGLIGKWHLTEKGNGPGNFDPATMPNAQGFDYFYGTPLFNGFTVLVEDTKLRVPILRNQEIVNPGVESWDNITADYTKEAINYIEKNKDEPFFLYLAHNMPHIPVGASDNFKGKSAYGPYGDTIEEIDWSTGQILDKLKALGIDDNTLIVYTSDNGPWVETTRGMKQGGKAFIPRDHSGSAAPLRGWKMSAWDGGCKVPFIARWPKKIAPGRENSEILTTMDLLPTFANLAGAELPADRTIDGKDATDFLLGKSEESPRDDYLYYSGTLLTGVRHENWKLVLPRAENPRGTGWWGRMLEAVEGVQLFNLDADPGETTNLAGKHPGVVADLQKRIKAARAELGDLNVVGAGARVFDKVPRKIQGMPASAGKGAKAAAKPAPSNRKKPNFVIIFTDDQGFGDLECLGGDHVRTPRINKMAAEGMKLTSFYVAAPVCTPSRAALMTGSYPKRVDMAVGSTFPVLLAGDKKGLNPDEITIAEVLRDAGYKTGMFGKWHLGDQPEFLPTKQGFDEYFGIPYSHDIHPRHPNNRTHRFPPLPLVDGETVVEMEPDADFLTKRFTEHAVEFIEKNKDHPFFLYVPHSIPHRPLHVSPPFRKDVDPEILDQLKKEGDSIDYKTRDKLFRQAIAEIDWSVGQILDTLKAQGIDDNTLVIFTSDNGPAIGSAGPFRGRKGSTFEGGMREPTVIRWTGHIPAGKTNDKLMTAMDLLPTFANLAGAEIPSDRVIDGKDIWPALTGDAPTPHRAFFYHRQNNLEAVRSGNWKLHLRKEKPTQLYDLQADPGESTDVIKDNPAVVKKLAGYASDFTKELSENIRPAAFVETAKPLSKSN